MFDVQLLTRLHDKHGFNFCICNNKKPMYKDWPNRDDFAEVIPQIEKNTFEGQLSGVVPQNFVIIDIDSHKNETPQDLITDLLQNSFTGSQMPLTVKTAKGGYHVYLKITSSYEAQILSKTVPGYPGVDLLSHGMSVHFPGNSMSYGEYQIVYGYNSNMDEIYAKDSLLQDFVKVQPTKQIDCIDLPKISSAQLRELLKPIETRDYRSRTDWLALCFSCHAATHGAPEALSVFLEWCERDPRYANPDDRDNTTQTWENSTVREGGVSRITIGTLLHEHDKYSPIRPFNIDYQPSKLPKNQEADVLTSIDGLDRDRKGEIKNTQKNRQIVFNTDSYLSKAFRYDNFTCRIHYLPTPDSESYKIFSKDRDVYSIRTYIANKYDSFSNLTIRLK